MENQKELALAEHLLSNIETVDDEQAKELTLLIGQTRALIEMCEHGSVVTVDFGVQMLRTQINEFVLRWATRDTEPDFKP